MNHDDSDVLTFLRTQANEGAPALTLQADEVMRAGRRLRTRRRVLGVGAGIGVGAAAVVAAISFSGSDLSSSPEQGPADHPTSPTEQYTAHMMPALLKEVALSPFDKLPDWTSFRIDAFASVGDRTSLPEQRWSDASMWQLRGKADDGSISLTLIRPGRPVAEGPETYCARERAGGALRCDYATIPDGRDVIQIWQVPTDRSPWYTKNVMVVEPRSGYTIAVREQTSASSLAEAARGLWLSEQELVEMATHPDLELQRVLPTPDGATSETTTSR